MTITKEGSLASFYTVNKAPIKHLRVYFSPKQVGEGDPSPSNIRSISGWNKIKFYHTGKNLFNKDEIISGYYISNGNLIANEHYGYLYIDIHNLSSITISGCYNNSSARFSFYTQNMTYISSSQQRPRTLTVPNNAYYLSVSAIIDTTLSSYDLNTIQVETGDITTTYESFQNQIPIEFPRIGKNIVDDSLRYYQANSFVLGTNQNIQYPTYLEAGTYRITVFGYNNTYAFVQEKNSNTWITVFENDTTGIFTITNNNYYRLMLLTTTTAEISNITHIMVSKGTEVQNNYEPFNNTVYGGYVDLITGELVQTYHKITLTNTNTIYSISDVSSSSISPLTKVQYPSQLNNIILNEDILDALLIDEQTGTDNYSKYTHGIYLPDTTNQSYHGVVVSNRAKTSSFAIVFLPCSATESDVKSYLKSQYDNGTPVELVYKLATPITHQLTPQQLQTLIGQNNIWSNADCIEVEYDLAESNDELYRRRNIILGGYPHIETVSENIAHFNTDLAVPLKECKINFLPIQAGSGDPSPENVREVSGRNELYVYPLGKGIRSFKTNSYEVTLDYFNGNDGWCNGISNSTALWGQTVTYSADIDATNATGSGAIGFIKTKADGVTFDTRISGTIVTQGNIGRSQITIQIPGNGIRIFPAIIAYKGCIVSNPMVEIGNNATEYEPMHSTSILINWQNTFGTIYGGYVDLINGELVETWYKIKGSNLTWSKNIGNYATFTAWTNPKAHTPVPYSRNFIYCPIYKTANWNTSTTNGDNYVWIYSNGMIRLKDTSKQEWTAEEFSEYIKDIDFIYELETPIHYSLSPQTLKTLKGTNNIWSNTNGPIEVKYWTH